MSQSISSFERDSNAKCFFLKKLPSYRAASFFEILVSSEGKVSLVGDKSNGLGSVQRPSMLVPKQHLPNSSKVRSNTAYKIADSAGEQNQDRRHARTQRETLNTLCTIQKNPNYWCFCNDFHVLGNGFQVFGFFS